MTSFNRRQVLGAAAATAAAFALPIRATAAKSNFRIGVISDEISQDFDHACHVIRNEYGLSFVELRELWGVNLQQATSAQIADALKVLAKYNLTVTDISSPLFKCSFPGAPVSRFASKGDLHGAAETTFKQQDDILRRSIELAKTFKTDKVRCFDFWRLDDVTPFRAAINDKLQQSAEFCGQHNIQLVLENEPACNTATGRESGATLAGVPSAFFFLNWDPGNAAMHGEHDAFPNGWNAIPKHRIHHCHVKNAVNDASGKTVWSPVDIGFVDWTAQFKALKAIGYSYATNLETHWRGGGSPEQSSDRSWQGMKKCLIAAGCL